MDLIQIGGALLVLAAFTAAQLGRVDQRSPGYLALNVVGSAALAFDALHGREWGFLLLEGAWTLVSAWGLAARLRGGAAAPAH